MNSDFPGKIICKYNDHTLLYGVTWNQIIDSNIIIENWKFNRPPDFIRIPQIANHIRHSDYIDGIIYLVKTDTIEDTDSSGNKITKTIYECYDGIHRIEALRYLQKSQNVNHKVVFHITNENDDIIIKSKFEKLNKCIPVPELYSNASKQLDLIKKVEEIAKHFVTIYSKHFSPNRKTNVPNENRDLFIDKLSTFITSYRLSALSVEYIISTLERYNTIMKENVSFYKLTKKQLDKCKKYNCYMFISKNWIISLEKLYTNDLINIEKNGIHNK